MTQVQSLFVRADSTITFDGDLRDLAENSIGIISKTSYGPTLDAALADKLFNKVDFANSSQSNLRKLLAGRVDVIPSYQHVVLSTAKELGAVDKIKQLSPDLESIPSYLAFSKKGDFTKIIKDYNKALISMKRDGTYDIIFNKYLK